MDYNDISKYLKRYSFSSKMGISQKYSRKIITPMGIIPIEEMSKGILPWELETFVLFAVEAEEYNDEDIFVKNESRFLETVNAIRARKQTDDLKMSGTKNLVAEMLIRYGLTQFELQEHQDYKYFRYHYFFNYQSEEDGVDIKKEFMEKFGVEYNKIMLLGIAFNISLCSKDTSTWMINFIADYYGNALNPLSITRDKYMEQLKYYANNRDDYVFCVRPSYSFPFIIDNSEVIHIPLPHLLYRATTSALLYRLTENNLKLRDKIGRYVVESYISKILDAANIYDEVLSERKYKIKGKEHKTPDICVRSKESVLFIESKSSVPPASIRWLKQEANTKYIEKITDAIDQLYKQLKHFLDGKFHVFSNEFEESIEKDNVWGIVSLLEDSFIMREVVYKEYAKLADISEDGEEYKWIVEHIKVVSLYDIEKFTFIGNSIIDELSRNAKEKQPFDFSLSDVEGKGLINPDIQAFMVNIYENIEKMLDKMEEEEIKTKGIH